MLTRLGRSTLKVLDYTGSLGLLIKETFTSLRVAPIRWRLVLEQMLTIGSNSQLIVAVTGAFTGAVFTAQTCFQFRTFGMESAVGSVVSISLFRELGPALGALMVAGRVGSAIAAEIGTMKVTEQIDAMRSLGVHPVDYLVVPRALAMLISMPLLVVECVALGIIASWIVGVQILNIAEAPFIDNILKYTTERDMYISLCKGFFFGFVIVFISCLQGLNAKNGAAGVGQAPTSAVVISSIAILIFNFILTFALNIIFPMS